MRRILALTAALFGLSLVACGDPTEPEQSVADALTIIGGNFQLAAVTEQLPNPLRVEATDALGLPVEGQLVCYVAATEGAGEPFQPCLETDVEGVGEMPWTLGELAGEHLAQARAMVDGEPVAVADYVLEAVPGPAADYPFRAGWDATSTVAEAFTSSTVADAYGNPVEWMFGTDCACVVVAGDFEDWPASRSVDAASVGSGGFHILLTPADTLASGTVEVTEPEPGVLRWTIRF